LSFCYLRRLLLLDLNLFLRFCRLLNSIHVTPHYFCWRLVNILALIVVFSDSAGLGGSEAGLCGLLRLIEVALGGVAVGAGEGAG
jgi:hypothetical protein